MSVDLVLIGRNEGERLIRALHSARGQARRLIYVDSGSTDGSVAAARAAGALVVELDMSIPFSAARARNAGFEAAQATDPAPFVQFIDGDCALVPGWLAAAEARLSQDDTLGLVTGWRSEIAPEASLYNRICDHEWRRPAGPIVACGGDMMVRAKAFAQAGGFDPTVIAAEDDDFCLRLARAGWQLERLPLEMTRHDAAMTHFAQWWRRAVRAGHGFAQVGLRHPGHFRTEQRRVLAWGLVLPVIALVGAAKGPAVPVLVVLLYALSWLRSAKGLRAEGMPAAEARKQALLLTLSKFPNLIGMGKYWLTHLARRRPRIIEYQ
ncbi:glycosyltransferase [Ruegeria pomeroyi]|uniref:Glycosyltransferase n=1 Tax=Ruegeria alba TaxID=2916756 RepID=A0ABS9NW95_9RHOB|nr:glycosyltransferase family 2 protein [Ruegeria alba]MCE8512889.1 glycosyltransferase [Ruegeria pomeroyi]MCE8521805.1 glycosyltransferase [Ruegeria pomeroyi]MCE8526379.1 glycosyltransferase [Ruegeria pomeroyi]MCE8529647.1 glycosyltransferase [Ruegeria pomeroyi]MCE8534425.1 glycosyltransferase [Ruegeria pomeroyi]